MLYDFLYCMHVNIFNLYYYTKIPESTFQFLFTFWTCISQKAMKVISTSILVEKKKWRKKIVLLENSTSNIFLVLGILCCKLTSYYLILDKITWIQKRNIFIECGQWQCTDSLKYIRDSENWSLRKYWPEKVST